VKGELTATVDAAPDPKATLEAAPTRSRKSKRRSTSGPSAGSAVRFFLSKADSNGIPTLDREFDSEPEAIVESLKTGRSYFVISEWKGLADVSKKVPLIRKEAVGNKKTNSI
jgi:hypothetical protein